MQQDNHPLNFPKIGDMVDSSAALSLCTHFGLDYLLPRIQNNPQNYNHWKFDGCSCLPDEMLGLFTGCNWEDITYQCCLPHDLGYAYGEPGDEEERMMVDAKFFNDLVNKAGMSKWCAAAFLAGVRAGGVEYFGLSFSWGFARK